MHYNLMNQKLKLLNINNQIFHLKVIEQIILMINYLMHNLKRDTEKK